MAIKDNVAVAGVPMQNGTALLDGYVPDEDATVVERVLDAGGTILGKAVCESLCFSGGSHTADSGPVRNPYDPARSTGGSSTGAARKAEVSVMLRFAGGLHIVSGRIVIEAELDSASIARRLRRDIADVFGHPSDLLVVQAGGLRRATRYVLRVARDGESLARQTGLLDGRGRPVRGLPSHIVSSSTQIAEAAWRGALP